MFIEFHAGRTVQFAELPDDSIALDGYVQGPFIDAKRRRFSFDHHGACLRSATKATCQQIWEAVKLGLRAGDVTKVFVNDIDLDSVLSVWLLLNPEVLDEGDVRHERIREMVETTALHDAHGPVFPEHEMDSQMEPYPDEKPSREVFIRCVGYIDRYLEGDLVPANFRDERSVGWGWSPSTGWKEVEVASGFRDFYDDGFLFGFLAQPAGKGTTRYTVAKASDFVAADVPKALNALRMLERLMNASQDPATSWGGASTIGGSPRNPDGTSSVLEPKEVLEVLEGCLQ